MEDLKYLGAILSIKNDWSKEINIRTNKAEKTFYALLKFLNSKTPSRRSKMRLYVSIIKSLQACSPWTTTTTATERKLDVGSWRRRYIKELQEIMNFAPVNTFIEGQRIQWLLGHILRREENDSLRVAFEWKSVGKRPRGRLREMWVDGVTEDLNTMDIEDGHEIVQDRKEWRDIVVTAIERVRLTLKE